MITKQHIWLAVIIAAGIILGAIIFRGCESSPSHKQEAKEVKVLQEKLQKVEKEKATDSARLVHRSDSLQALNLDLKNKKDAADKELAKLRKDTRRISDKLDTARAKKDTLGYITACDSLQERSRLQDEVITIYQAYVDSVEYNHEVQLATKDSLLANRAALITQLRTANDKTFLNYQQISSDYTKVTRKLKRERTLSRILAAVVAVGGGMILFK